MARGGPDYGVGDYVVSQTNTDTTDVIATNLNFGRLDSMGRIMFVDDFSHGYSNWVRYKVATGVLPVIDSNSPNGFVSGVGVSFDVTAQNDESGLYRGFILPSTKKMGVEIAIKPSGSQASLYLRVDHQTVAGTKFRGEVRWNSSTGQLEIYSGGAWVTVPMVYELAVDGVAWLQMKIALDWERLTYGRLVVGASTVDLSAYNLFTYSGGQIAFDRLTIFAKNDGSAFHDNVYLGCVIITMDEP